MSSAVVSLVKLDDVVVDGAVTVCSDASSIVVLMIVVAVLAVKGLLVVLTGRVEV